MKLINYNFLTKEEQKHDKGIIMNNGDILHIVINKKLRSEIVIYCENDVLKIENREKYLDDFKAKKERIIPSKRLSFLSQKFLQFLSFSLDICNHM